MKTTYAMLVISVAAGFGGCAEPDVTGRFVDAAELAEKRTGFAPDWESPWDETMPVAEGSQTLELRTAIITALRNNRELRADLEMIGEADADLVQAGLMANPVINFMVMFPSGGGRTMLRGNALPMQPLQDLWMIPARKDAASADLREAVLRTADRAVETLSATKRAYVEAQFAQRAIELMTENIELVTESISIIQAGQTAGQASQVSANLARIRQERLRSDLLAMSAELAAKKYELLMLMGSPQSPAQWRVTPLEEIADKAAVPADETELILLAAEQRLDLKSREWTVEGTLRKITVARREGWPDLALGFSFERAPRGRTRGASVKALAADAAARGFVEGINGGGESNFSGGEIPQIAPLPRPTREVTYTFGPMFELELPIFDWGQAQTAKAIHAYRRALASYDAKLHEIIRDVRTTLARQHEAGEQLRLYRETILPEVQRNLELAKESYVAGQTDLTVFLQSQEDAIGTRQRMLEYLKAYRVLEADLERAVGGERSLASLGNVRQSKDANERAESELISTIERPAREPETADLLPVQDHDAGEHEVKND